MGRKGSSNRESNNYIDSDRVSVERVPHKAYNELYNLKVIKFDILLITFIGCKWS